MSATYLNNLINEKASRKIDSFIDAYLRKERLFELTNLWSGLTLIRLFVIIPISFLLFVDANVKKTLWGNALIFFSYVVIQLGFYFGANSTAKRKLNNVISLLGLNFNTNSSLFVLSTAIDLIFYFYIIFLTDQIYYDTYLLLFIPIVMISFYSRSAKGTLLNIAIAIIYFISFIGLGRGQHALLFFWRMGSFIFMGFIIGLYHFLLNRLFCRQHDLLEHHELELTLSKTFNVEGTDIQCADAIANIIVNEIIPDERDTLCAAIFGAYTWDKTLKLKGIAGMAPLGFTGSLKINFGDGIIGEAAVGKKMAFSNDIVSDPKCNFFTQYNLSPNHARLALIVMPLLDNRENLLGLLIVGKHYTGVKRSYDEVLGKKLIKALFSLLKTVSVLYANSVYALRGRRNQRILDLRKKIDAVIPALEENRMTTLVMYDIGKILQDEIKATEVLFYEYTESLDSLNFKTGTTGLGIPYQLKKNNLIYVQAQKMQPPDVVTRKNDSIFLSKYQTYTLLPIWVDEKLAALYIFLRAEERRKTDFQIPATDRRLLYPEILLTKSYDKVYRVYRNSLLRDMIRLKNSQLDLVLDESRDKFLRIDKEKIVQEATKFAKDMFQAEAATVYIVDEKKEKLILKHACGFKGIEQVIDKHSYWVDNPSSVMGLPAYIYFHPKPALVAHAPTEFKNLPSLSGQLIQYYQTLPYYQTLTVEEKISSLGVCSYIGVPIISVNAPESVLGVLQIYNKRGVDEKGYAKFLESDKRHLEALAMNIAIALERANEKEEISKAKEQFVSNTLLRVVHEIRQPVASLFMLNNALTKFRENSVPANHHSVVHALDRIKTAGARISDIANSMNDAFAFRKINCTSIGINELIRTTTEENINLMKNKDTIKVITDCQEGGLKVFLDPLKIQQVLHILINNAVEAMPKGGTLYLRAKASDHKLIIEAEDTGTGISKSIQNRIFKPFETTKAPGEGMGIGLTIALNIVKAHNGDLEFESQEGKGTTFRIILSMNIKKTEEKNHE